MKRTSKIRRIGLIANTDKPAAIPLLRRAVALITRHDCLAVADQASARLAGLKIATQPDALALGRNCDMVLVFGGDGTMLRVAREIAGIRTPILGINIGGLGFLTAVSSDELASALKRILAGDYTLETRPLIETTAWAGGKKETHCAFNDVVISRGEQPRLVELEVSVNQEVLTNYRADGLIVSSPTGSTAYSLAAGGAIVAPDADVLALTPICPHTLSNRSVILNGRAAVRVRIASERTDVVLAADGHPLASLGRGDAVLIRRSRRAVRLVRLGGASFFQTLRRKLHWSGSHV